MFYLTDSFFLISSMRAFSFVFLLCCVSTQLLAQRPKPVMLFPDDCCKRDVLNGNCISDTGYVYAIPFEMGKDVKVAQTYNTAFSHKGLLAVDFKVKPGTPIHAARAGKVIDTKDDSKTVGLKAKHEFMANYVVVLHDDGTIARYRHLEYKGVAVKVGQVVEVGDLLGYSGHTGYSMFPHLHFEVRAHARLEENPAFLSTRFRTQEGVHHLRAWRKYRRVEDPNTIYTKVIPVPVHSDTTTVKKEGK